MSGIEELVGKVETSMTPQERFEEYLQSRGKRNTASRRVLIDHVFAQHDHFDADSLIEKLPAKGHKDYVSRATVYRALGEFVEAGLLREFQLDNRMVYEHDYGYPQHDHLYCTKCEQLTEFRNEDLLALRDRIADEHGFRVELHRMTIHGVCEKCRQSSSRKRRRVDLI